MYCPKRFEGHDLTSSSSPKSLRLGSTGPHFIYEETETHRGSSLPQGHAQNQTRRVLQVGGVMEGGFPVPTGGFRDRGFWAVRRARREGWGRSSQIQHWPGSSILDVTQKAHRPLLPPCPTPTSAASPDLLHPKGGSSSDRAPPSPSPGWGPLQPLSISHSPSCSGTPKPGRPPPPPDPQGELGRRERRGPLPAQASSSLVSIATRHHQDDASRGHIC